MFDLACSKERVCIRPGQDGAIEVTITNQIDEDRTGILVINTQDAPPPSHPDRKPKRRVKDAGKAPISWHCPPQLQLGARETMTCTATLSTTPQAEVGDYRFEVLIADEKNPDEQFATRVLPVIVLPLPEDKRRNWWPLVALAVGLLLFILILVAITRPSFIEVPRVIGTDLQTATHLLEDAGFSLEVVDTKASDLDRAVMASLLAERRRLHKKAVTHAEQLERDEEEFKEPATLAKHTPKEAPPLKPNLVWWQDDDDIEKRGTVIHVKVVPELIPIPKIVGLPLTDAMKACADAGFRFESRQRRPPVDQRQGLAMNAVWKVGPEVTLEWDSFWQPTVDPNADDKEVDPDDQEEEADKESTDRLAYKHSRLILYVASDNFLAPDLRHQPWKTLLETKDYHLRFHLGRQTLNVGQMSNMYKAYQKAGTQLFIYRQHPAPGTRLQGKQPHINLYVAPRRGRGGRR